MVILIMKLLVKFSHRSINPKDNFPHIIINIMISTKPEINKTETFSLSFLNLTTN